jgi:hypothetical protein
MMENKLIQALGSNIDFMETNVNNMNKPEEEKLITLL